ncbi:uncharacterized protein LOC114446745 [Parambassis ranga]|uniref:Uncharacterized protein LOC114446745 n=1 Tax=Parambassis ranga TaxID=210632 RepID=A0A6P7JN97_9TELE|nr:uncharacterized protein LOC114446745 [Parambassis ranga]
MMEVPWGVFSLMLLHILTGSTSDGLLMSCGSSVCPLGEDCISINGSARCADPCDHYTVLNDTWRSTNNSISNNVHAWHGDYYITWQGWYRLFLGQYSARIPERCVETYRCGTHAPLWITEPHPTQCSEIVNRTVCGAWTSGCCQYPQNNIYVKRCYGNFYVYKLVQPICCGFAYCAEVNTTNPRTSSSVDLSFDGQWGTVCEDSCNLNNANSKCYHNTVISLFLLFLPLSRKCVLWMWFMMEVPLGVFSLMLLHIFTGSTSDGLLMKCGSSDCPLGEDCISINGSDRCADPCDHYTVLNDMWRSTNNSISNGGTTHCDQHITWQGWYCLFLGQYNAQIPERCVATDRCGTHAPMWITEPHPTHYNKIVNRTACGAWVSGCCSFPPNDIYVKRCYGNFYVYKLVQPNGCNLAYCAEVNTTNPRTSSSVDLSFDGQWGTVCEDFCNLNNANCKCYHLKLSYV